MLRLELKGEVVVVLQLPQRDRQQSVVEAADVVVPQRLPSVAEELVALKCQ